MDNKYRNEIDTNIDSKYYVDNMNQLGYDLTELPYDDEEESDAKNIIIYTVISVLIAVIIILSFTGTIKMPLYYKYRQISISKELLKDLYTTDRNMQSLKYMESKWEDRLVRDKLNIDAFNRIDLAVESNRLLRYNKYSSKANKIKILSVTKVKDIQLLRYYTDKPQGIDTKYVAEMTGETINNTQSTPVTKNK